MTRPLGDPVEVDDLDVNDTFDTDRWSFTRAPDGAVTVTLWSPGDLARWRTRLDVATWRTVVSGMSVQAHHGVTVHVCHDDPDPFTADDAEP